MPSKPACVAGSCPAAVERTAAQVRSRRSGIWRICALAALAGAAAQPAAAAPPALPQESLASSQSDTPIWRAMHGLLLAVTRAGKRLVAVGNEGVILLSDDEGADWRAVHAPTDELLTGVLFPTPQEGWVVGQDQLVLHSKDAGQSWTQVHFAAGTDQALFAITAVGAAPHLVATGAYDLLLETQDGLSWRDAKIPNLDDDFHLNCVAARGDDLLVTGEAGHAFTRHGSSWTQIKLPYEGSQFTCQLGADGTFYSFGLRGSAFRLPAGSTAWARIDLGGDQSTFGSATLSDGRIVLVGSNGTVRLLDPAKGVVKTLPPVSDQTISGVTETAPGHLVTVGTDGVHLIDINAAATAAGDAP